LTLWPWPLTYDLENQRKRGTLQCEITRGRIPSVTLHFSKVKYALLLYYNEIQYQFPDFDLIITIFSFFSLLSSATLNHLTLWPWPWPMTLKINRVPNSTSLDWWLHFLCITFGHWFRAWQNNFINDPNPDLSSLEPYWFSRS
jgi:hypothetical protein